MESLTTSAREFLDLCDMEYLDGSGHSLEALSPSEIDKASSDTVGGCGHTGIEPTHSHRKAVPSHSTAIPTQEQNDNSAMKCECFPKSPSNSNDTSTVPETPESVVLETPPELHTAPVAHSTPQPCGDTIGFRIYPEEVPPSLAAATIKLAKKYFLK